jgi:hypothetical protein
MKCKEKRFCKHLQNCISTEICRGFVNEAVCLQGTENIHQLREFSNRYIFENKAPKRIFGRKLEEVTEGWRELHNEALHNLYSSPKPIWVISSKEDAISSVRSTNEGDGKCMKNRSQKPERKVPLAIPWRKREENIKTHHKEARWQGGEVRWQGVTWNLRTGSSGGRLWST